MTERVDVFDDRERVEVHDAFDVFIAGSVGVVVISGRIDDLYVSGRTRVIEIRGTVCGDVFVMGGTGAFIVTGSVLGNVTLSGYVRRRVRVTGAVYGDLMVARCPWRDTCLERRHAAVVRAMDASGVHGRVRVTAR